jgi:hypothetical protein
MTGALRRGVYVALVTIFAAGLPGLLPEGPTIPWNGRRINLRVESFNTFNWVNYGRPGQSVSNAATFGRISPTQGDPRELQFAVKFYF